MIERTQGCHLHQQLLINYFTCFLPERYVRSPIIDVPVLFNLHLFRSNISSEWKSFALLPGPEFWSALSLTASSILCAPRSRISAALVRLYKDKAQHAWAAQMLSLYTLTDQNTAKPYLNEITGLKAMSWMVYLKQISVRYVKSAYEPSSPQGQNLFQFL